MSTRRDQPAITYSRVMTVRATPTPSAESLMALARDRAVDPSIFDTYPPAFFSAEISSSRWDAYQTRMGRTTLQNYAAEAASGVAFLRNHDTYSDPMGHSLTGRLMEDGDVLRVESEFYLLQDPESTGYINKLRAGIVRDTSVGFYDGEWVCSLCGRDMSQWFGTDACPHLLGVAYVSKDASGNPTGEELVARATIENAHLAEFSGVYDGATPGAMIAKARWLSAEGLMDDRLRELVSVRYRTPLLAPGRSWHLGALQEQNALLQDVRTAEPSATSQTPPSGGKEHGMSDETRTAPPSAGDNAPPAGEEQGRLLTALQGRLTALAPEGHRSDPLAWIEGELTRLRPLADDGAAYRSDLVAEALQEGVRAHGEGFAAETYRGILQGAPLEAVKRMRDDWRAAGDALFARGEGQSPRITQDGPTTPPEQRSHELPPAAYAA